MEELERVDRAELQALLSEALSYGHYVTAARLRELLTRLRDEETGSFEPNAQPRTLASLWQKRPG